MNPPQTAIALDEELGGYCPAEALEARLAAYFEAAGPREVTLLDLALALEVEPRALRRLARRSPWAGQIRF